MDSMGRVNLRKLYALGSGLPIAAAMIVTGWLEVQACCRASLKLQPSFQDPGNDQMWYMYMQQACTACQQSQQQQEPRAA
jgi:hypothetical protein